MEPRITPELRAHLEDNHLLCAEVPSRSSDCRAWVTVYPRFDGDALERFIVRHFEFKRDWMEREYDPCADEMPLDESQVCITEYELEAHLSQVLPSSATLIRVADDPDYPM